MERRLDVLQAASSAPRLASSSVEYCTSDDKFYDYVLHEYPPLTPPAGKQRSMNLLVESFALAGVEPEGVAILAAIERGLGRGRTVWGIKQRRGTLLGWELYFYDYERHRADLSIAHVVSLLQPFVTIDAIEPRPLPWHMFSVEISPSLLGAVQVYIDMRSYALSANQLQLQNIYTFHDPQTDIDDILHRLHSSVHFGRGDQLAALLSPSLRRCHRICVANKRAADALYCSRIPSTALAAFMRQYGWPLSLPDAMDHLQWDVGLDFASVDGRLTVGKTGLYGHF